MCWKKALIGLVNVMSWKVLNEFPLMHFWTDEWVVRSMDSCLTGSLHFPNKLIDCLIVTYCDEKVKVQGHSVITYAGSSKL